MISKTNPVFFIYADDDKDDHEILSTAIKSSVLTYRLKSVYDGDELIKFLSKNITTALPDFLVIDLNMPKVDGFTAIKQIKSETQFENIPIYVLSTSGRLDDRQKAKAYGVTGFYTKPAKLSELRDILEEMALKSLKLKNPKHGDVQKAQRS